MLPCVWYNYNPLCGGVHCAWCAVYGFGLCFPVIARYVFRQPEGGQFFVTEAATQADPPGLFPLLFYRGPPMLDEHRE